MKSPPDKILLQEARIKSQPPGESLVVNRSYIFVFGIVHRFQLTRRIKKEYLVVSSPEGNSIMMLGYKNVIPRFGRDQKNIFVLQDQADSIEQYSFAYFPETHNLCNSEL